MGSNMKDEVRYITDAYPPPEIARNVEQLGVVKAQTDVVTLLVLPCAGRVSWYSSPCNARSWLARRTARVRPPWTKR